MKNKTFLSLRPKRSNLVLVIIIFFAIFLRTYKLSQVPVSLFGDELDVGYHAYSILKTGKDYSGNPWPLHFHSLAEWRTPLYLYSTVPTVAIFGISPLGVRLPAAIFGVLGVWGIYLLTKEIFKEKTGTSIFGFRIWEISALLLSISPWHLQYSRAAFEVTQLLFFLIFGLYFFLKSLKNGKWLWVSATCFAFMPWVYSTAKLFTPILLVFLILIYYKELLLLTRKYLVWAAFAMFIVGTPIAISTLFGGGAERFNYISIFTDPTTESVVGEARSQIARMRGDEGTGLTPTITDRLLQNKYQYWSGNILSNYLYSFSTDFLFIKGDYNLRHSIENIGQFYAVEIVTLILGIIFFFKSKANTKTKALIAFWVLAGAFPSAITRGGAGHATRLILVLPPLIILISYGVLSLKHKLIHAVYIFLLLIGATYYLHNYYVHNPWGSERWWHAGFQDSIQSIKALEKDYNKVVISTMNEPPWVFFAAWYEYPPNKWHTQNPIGNDVELAGFGKISHTDKFYFGSPEGGLYDWGKILDNKTLYLATEKEVNVNLILEPERTPGDLELIKAIPYPSGQPAFYLFTGRNDE